jgi:hypothetical protein
MQESGLFNCELGLGREALQVSIDAGDSASNRGRIEDLLLETKAFDGAW